MRLEQKVCQIEEPLNVFAQYFVVVVVVVVLVVVVVVALE